MKKPFYKKIWFWVVAVIAIATIGSQLGSKEATDDKDVVKSEFAVGETIKKDGIYTVVVNSVEYKSEDSSGFIVAEDGNELIYIDVTIQNDSDEEMAVSSILSFELKDEDGRKQAYTIVADMDGQLDGKILKGEKMSGEIVFEVEKDKPINFYISLGNIFTATPIKVVIR